MSEFREQLEAAKGDYHARRYPGDLATELLAQRQSSVILRLRWLAPLVAGALAALVAIVLWPHRPAPTPSTPTRIATTSPATMPLALNWPGSVPALDGARYDAYVSHVSTNVKEAVSQLQVNFDVALDAPVVSDGVATVRQVAGDLQEIALATWSQVRPRREPGL